MPYESLRIPRAVLATLFKSARDLGNFEQQQDIVLATPDAVKQAQDTADDAQGKVNDIKGNARFLVLALTGSLAQERRLVGGDGVTITDGGANADATIEVDVEAAVGHPIPNKNGDTFNGDVTVEGTLEADHLKLNEAASASTAVATHSVPIDIGGVTYYLLLSTTP